jgi:hypothetical protein
MLIDSRRSEDSGRHSILRRKVLRGSMGQDQESDMKSSAGPFYDIHT